LDFHYDREEMTVLCNVFVVCRPALKLTPSGRVRPHG